MRALSAASTLLFLFIACSPFASDAPGDGTRDDAGANDAGPTPPKADGGGVDPGEHPDAADQETGPPTIARSDAYALAVHADKPIAYWRCRDADSITTLVTHNEVTGSPDAIVGKNGPRVQPGGLFSEGGGECVFTGLDDDQIATAASISYLGSNAYTLEAWLYLEVAPDSMFRHVFEDTDDGKGDAFGLFVRDSSAGQEIAAEEFIASKHVTLHFKLPELKAWHHLAMRNGPELLIDGALASPAANPETEGSMVDFSRPFSFGSKSGHEPAIKGRLTEIAIYDKALTDAQISDHYALGKP